MRFEVGSSLKRTLCILSTDKQPTDPPTGQSARETGGCQTSTTCGQRNESMNPNSFSHLFHISDTPPAFARVLHLGIHFAFKKNIGRRTPIKQKSLDRLLRLTSVFYRLPIRQAGQPTGTTRQGGNVSRSCVRCWFGKLSGFGVQLLCC